MTLVHIPCQYCKKQFWAVGRHARYCSGRCRSYAWRDRQPPKVKTKP